MDNFHLVRSQMSRGDIIKALLRVSFVSIITFYSVKWMMGQIDPTNKNKKKAKALAEIRLRRLNRMKGYHLDVNNFNEYELMIASHIVVPADISEGWTHIAGLDRAIQELKDSVVFPVTNSNRFKHSKLWHPPKGVLLHGPPGCGKTLIAKATAKEAGMLFVNLDVSILTDKWYGESQKLATAVFSLAVKIQPCIIFIDEIDSFLRNRNTSDHEATAMMKTQFMMLWDGLNTTNDATVIVMGATNRPQDLDKAILRRMPAQIFIGLPDIEQRHEILKLILQDENLNESVDLRQLAKKTIGFSGSDLKELCRGASVFSVRKFMRSENEKSNNTDTDADNLENGKANFQIDFDDLEKSFDKIKLSKAQTGQFHIDNRIDLD